MNHIESVSKVKAILKETDYKICVTGSEGGCTLSLPTKKFAPKRSARTIKYEMLKGGGVNITGDVDSYWICPDYVTRGSIYVDILKKCQEYDYSPLAILYANEDYDEANSILEILEAPEGVKLSDELTVLDLAQTAIQSNTIEVLVELREEAEYLNVREGLDFMISNFIGKVF